MTSGNTMLVSPSPDGRIEILSSLDGVQVAIDVQGWWGSAERSVSYTYDSTGLGITKHVAGIETTYGWDRSGPLPLLLSETTLGQTTSWVYGPGGIPVQQTNPDGSTWYLHRDQIGSVRTITDVNGNIIGTASWDPYGKPTGTTGVTSPFGYAGQYTDAETGYQYLRARYYDPATGSFLTRDPIEAITRSPYAYVFGNPLNMVDPSGLCGWSDPWGCANDAAEFVGGLVPEEVRDADLGEFDWGTAAASGVNIVWGTQKMATGAVIIGTGTALIPFTSGISGPPAYIFGGYQLLTGGAKFYRGTQQFTQVISEPCEDEEDQRLGANASRFWKGVTPNFDNVIDFLGGLPV